MKRIDLFKRRKRMLIGCLVAISMLAWGGSGHAQTQSAADIGTGQYEVYALPSIGPTDSGNLGNPVLVAGPGLADPSASPFGWHDVDGVIGADLTVTRGNNVNVEMLDTGFQPDGGSNLLFSFPMGSVEAGFTQVYYILNQLHDIFYRYGFDEASGNFQDMNYSGDGLENDGVHAIGQLTGMMGGATMDTKADGIPPILRFKADDAYDNTIVIHEYTHGVSTRLTGGAGNENCLRNGEQMGEGWSDFFAVALTTLLSESRFTPRAVGNYSKGQGRDGSGGRKAFFTSDFTLNNVTYDDFDIDIAGTVPYKVGFIWATMLWELYWNFIDVYGFDPTFSDMGFGNNMALQLIVEGMKRQPCSPGMVDGRNAILEADRALNNGANACLIWDAFSRRGLGPSADQGTPYSHLDGIAAPLGEMPSTCDADFFLTTNIDVAPVCASDNATFDIGVFSHTGGTDAVSLFATGTPAGAEVDFAPASLVPGNESRLTVSNLSGADPGVYHIDISGTNGHHDDTVAVTVSVFDASPDTVTVRLPEPDAENQSRKTFFDWSGIAQSGTTYELTVATDPAFDNVALSTVTTASSYKIPGIYGSQHAGEAPLDALTRYYWHVKAMNPCGQAAVSETASFTTGGTPQILLVDDDNPNFDVRDYYVEALDAVGVSYDIWDTFYSDIEPDAAFLKRYRTIVWFSSEKPGVPSGPGEQSSAALADFLESGGKGLFISSLGFMWRVSNGVTGDFATDYLGVSSTNLFVENRVVTGQGICLQIPATDLDYPGETDWFTGAGAFIIPTVDAETVFLSDGYDWDVISNNNVSGIAAVSKETSNYRTTTWSYPFESLPTPDLRAQAMSAVVDWLLPIGALGDVDTNGRIDDVDAILISQMLVGLSSEPFDGRVADVNCDSHIDINDALLVAQYHAGLITEFPCTAMQ